MSAPLFLIAAGFFGAVLAFWVWIAWTCGYDRGWADKEDGLPHRELRKEVRRG